MDNMAEKKSDKTDGTAACRIWIAYRRNDDPPSIADFVTGCNSQHAAKRYLANWGLKNYAGYDHGSASWFTPALTHDNNQTEG